MMVAGRKSIWPEATLQSKWTEMTTDHFWHRLVGLPEYMNNPSLSIRSADDAGYDNMKTLGQQLFTLVCSSSGKLQFVVPQPAGNRQHLGGTQGERHLPKLVVQYVKPLVYYDGSLCGQEYWQIDGNISDVNPPCLQVDKMPGGVVAVHAHVTCQLGCIDLPDLLYVRRNNHYMDNQAVKEFAYDGNVYSAAWLECLSATA